MGGVTGNQIPITTGMMNLPGASGKNGALLGSKCRDCGEKYFIVRTICENCQSTSLEDITLSDTGTLYAFSVMYYPPPPPYVPADPFVPFGIGWVELPEGIVVYSLLTENDPQKLHVGMELKLTFSEFGQDASGNRIVVPMFTPR